MSDKKIEPEKLLGDLSTMAMPSADDAEKGVLSCLIQDPERVVEARMLLPPEAFYHLAHRIIYELLNECVAKGIGIDLISITHLLRDRGLLENVGGAAFISELFGYVTIPAHFPFYSAQVRDKWLLRELIEADATNIHEAKQHAAEMQPESVGALLSRSESRVFKVLDMFQSNGQGSQLSTSPQMMMEWQEKFSQICENRGKVLGLQTGWVDVDRTFHGLNPDGEGDLWLIGGFPGMGKTGAAVSLLENIAVDGFEDDDGHVTRTPCGVFPLEMGKVGWGHRLVLGRAGIDVSVSRNGHLPRWATDRGPQMKNLAPLDIASKQVRDAPIVWDNSAFLDCDNLRARVTMMVRKHGVKVVFIDHFGQLRPSSKEGRGDMGVRGKIEIMETLHELRRTLGITIILFVQLTKDGRENQKRNRPPDNGDVKGPGEMIEYPTMVSFIHRPSVVQGQKWHDLSEEMQERWREVTLRYRLDFPEAWHDGRDLPAEVYVQQRDYEEHARFIITKNRNGATCDDICLRYRLNLQRFKGRTLKLYSTNEKFRQVVLPGF